MAEGSIGLARLRARVPVWPGAWTWTDLRHLVGSAETVVCTVLLVGVLACATFADHLAPFPPHKQSLSRRLLPPLSQTSEGTFVLGTDQLGRDVLSRVIFGARASMLVGLGAVGAAGLLGLALGLVAGYLGGRVDTAVMRLVDVVMAFPYLILALAVVTLVGPGLRNLIVVFALTGWPVYARVVRSMTLTLRQVEFIEGARSLGASTSRLLLRHLLPNVINPVIVLASFDLARVIVAEATLSFFGVGIPPSIPSWGGMISDGREYLAGAWWLAVVPGALVTLVVVAVNLLGDRMRDVLDPQLSRAS